MLEVFFNTISWALIGYACVSIGTWLIPQLVQSYLLKEQDLKKKYNAKWALVTGGSSGIGRAIVDKLARQGLNVFIVALEDNEKKLENTAKELTERYPEQEFVAMDVNLAGVDEAIERIAEATKDHDIQLIFNNAGFIKMCLYAEAPVGLMKANYDVNLTSAIRITQLFANRLIQKKLRGGFVFTSSPSGMMPNPFATVYGCTKAAMSAFAASLAPELKPDGIDVLVVHPSPTDTAFYTEDAISKSDALVMFRRTATTPMTIAKSMFCQLGRSVVYDQGYFSIGMRFLLKVLDYKLFAWIVAAFSGMSGEYKKLSAERTKKNE